MVAFMVAGAMAGLAGGLLVEYLGSWTPSGWTVSEGFVVISALIIGGTANNIGAALGAFIVPVVIYELTAFIPPFGPVNSQTIDAFRWIAIGVIALLFLWFRPQGVLPEPRRHFRLPNRKCSMSAMHEGRFEQAGWCSFGALRRGGLCLQQR